MDEPVTVDVTQSNAAGRSALEPRFNHSFWHLLWHNRPVHEEQTFVWEFRAHSFEFVLVASWMLCILRTVVILYQQFLPAGPPGPVGTALLSGALLYWIPPLVFSGFKSWSRRYYHWVLDGFYAVYFFQVGQRVVSGSSHLDDANVMLLILIATSIIFVRIPFRHALVLTGLSTIAVDALAVNHFGLPASLRLVFSSMFTLVMALYTSWRMEERDRGLFSKRIEAAAQAQEARALSARAAQAAREEQQQRILAERAATEASIASGEKQRLHDQLSALYSQRELLIRGLHHDANQSLLVMGSALLGLKQAAAQHAAFEGLQGHIDTVALGARELDALIAGMYDLVMLGKYEPCYAPLSVDKLLDNVAVKFAGAAADKGLRFVVRRRKESLFLWTDATAMERIIGNLVSNAIKYTVRGGVVVGTVKHGNILRIDVWDTGVGIPRAEKNAIFGEFVRLEQSGVAGVKGLGLGLAIVKLFRDKLVGHYLEHSSKVGRGSRFSMSVPIAQPPADQPLQTSSSLASVGLGVSRLYVVVVDDNPAVVSSLAEVLRRSGYDIEDNVRFATCVVEVAGIFDGMPNRAPNVVVCDFRLRAGETANQVIQLLDARFGWERVPVVVFTAEINPAVDLRRPFLRVVAKSGDPTVLLQEIESVVVEARTD